MNTNLIVGLAVGAAAITYLSLKKGAFASVKDTAGSWLESIGDTVSNYSNVATLGSHQDIPKKFSRGNKFETAH